MKRVALLAVASYGGWEVDPATFLTIAGAVFLGVTCGVITYAFAIRETQKEIKAAFDEHIEVLHHEHVAQVAELLTESRE